MDWHDYKFMVVGAPQFTREMAFSMHETLADANARIKWVYARKYPDHNFRVLPV